MKIAKKCLQQQLAILSSCKTVLDSRLSNIRGEIESIVFDNSLEAAKELLRKQLVRSAGVIAGVILEGHLRSVCSNHGIGVKGKRGFYEPLYKAGIIDLSQKRKLALIGDIRNKCAHKNENDPTKEEVQEMIELVERAIKTIF